MPTAARSTEPVRFTIAPAVREALQRLERREGPLVIQHGIGCRGPESLVAYPKRTFRRGPFDVLVGTVEGMPVYVDPATAAQLAGRDVAIDACPSEGAGALGIAAVALHCSVG
ncbi:MAG: DUF779 domain-containing protein [Gemmatimonadales bacterium]|nr:DUF779 domain-containing protein [Gemmatimonadales bacterium]